MIDEMKINTIQREKYLSKGYWKDITLLDCWKESVKKYSEREYVVDDRGNRYTYRQMDEAASKVAAFLRKQGIVPAPHLERVRGGDYRLLYDRGRSPSHRHVL